MARTPCCDKNGLKKGPWTPEEDQKLIDYIHKHGYGNWRTLPKNAGLQRCGKSCRLRWTNYLRPDIKRGRFSFEEEEIIIQLHSILGNKWSAIAARLPGRTDNEIKNYWNTHIRKRLLRMGIDPVTHTPRLDLFTNSLYNSQISLSHMLSGAAQPLIDPDLLRLATSLISSHQQNNETQFPDNQFPQNQLLQPQQNIADFGAQWNSIGMGSNQTDYQDHCPNPTNQYYYNASGSDQPVMDGSVFYSTDNNFTTPSSTYISSPTTLNSNSTTTTYVNEDEREIISYACPDMLKFEIPDILDVSDFAANF